MKKTVFVIVLLIIAGGLAYFYFFYLSPVKKLKLINAVPSSAAFVIELDDPLKQWEGVTNSKIWKYLKTNPYLSEVANSIDSLNEEIQSNEALWDLTVARPMSISAHKIRKNEYDYLYVIDLQKASKFNFFKDYIDELVGDDAKVSTRIYHETEIIEFSFRGSTSIYYLYFNENLLVLSTTHTIIEQSIDEKDEPVIERDLNFIEVSRYMDDELPKIYLQHASFEQYLQQWLTEDYSMVSDFMRSMIYTAVNFEMAEDHFSLMGFSNRIDSTNLLINVFHKSGKGVTDLAEIAPENSTFFMSLGFNSAKEFYINLEQNIAESADSEEYFKDKKKLEKFLDISIEEHFLSWMDDEVGLIQLHSSDNLATNEIAVALKFKDEDDVIKNLDFIKNQVKKKTPVKFKGIEYKGYEINFLSIKSFFKVMFGKAFSKIDKPYYTILDDYVVFSNQPSTLGVIINNYSAGTTLVNNKSFENYFDRFDQSSTLFMYINPEQLIADSKKYLDKESWETIHTNKAYIECFPMIGLQILPKDGLMTTEMMVEYMNPQQIDGWKDLFTNQIFMSDSLFDNNSVVEESITIDDILPDDLNDKNMTHSFENGQVKFEVALKDGLKNGTYIEYDSLGNIIVKGKYKNDQKTGVWKYYNNEGEVIRKERN
ncbi:MAG: DUF3352 domain-containing protein [Cyclobacteriaceae bacterium]|nr:DUF3352 domain-containing protein [Cyclobacteriaceae bacterium]